MIAVISTLTVRGVRIEISEEEVTAANVCIASALRLFRIRARNIRPVYGFCCVAMSTAKTFLSHLTLEK